MAKKLSRSAQYYRDNPDARRKKKEYDSELQKRREQVRKRVEANRARRRAKAQGKNVEGKDASHTPDGIRFIDSSKNRGGKTMPGDKNARGRKRKK